MYLAKVPRYLLSIMRAYVNEVMLMAVVIQTFLISYSDNADRSHRVRCKMEIVIIIRC